MLINIGKLSKIYVSDLRAQFKYGFRAPLHHQLIYIDPSNIKFHTVYVGKLLPESCATVLPSIARQSRELWSKAKGIIRSGDWDAHTVPLSEVLPYQLAIKKLRTGQSWHEVGEYDRMLEIIAIKGHADGCRTLSDLDRRYHQLDAIALEVELHHRLKSQREISPSAFREKGGINVAIGRNGDIIKLEGGTHRLAIVKHFCLPAVPVCVRLVHEDFVRTGGFRDLLSAPKTLSPISEASHVAEPAE
jgi:hypothetical protein